MLGGSAHKLTEHQIEVLNERLSGVAPAHMKSLDIGVLLWPRRIVRLSFSACELLLLDEHEAQLARGLEHLHTSARYMTFAADEDSLRALRTEFLVLCDATNSGDPDLSPMSRAARSIDCALGEVPRCL